MLCGIQRCYGGVRFPLDHPSPRNVLRLDMGAIPLIHQMHENGIYLDTTALSTLHVKLGEEMEVIQSTVDLLADRRINPGSGDQVAKLLYEDLGLHLLYSASEQGGVLKSTPSQKRLSTDDEVLSKLKTFHPVVGAILDWRELDKLRSTYTGPLALHVNPHTGRIHTTFSVTRAATGRLASSNPNLQNIPVRGDYGNLIRKCFTTQHRNGRRTVLTSNDLSQIEMVMAAHASQDPKMMGVFSRGEDLHSFTALSMFRLNPADVQPDPEKHPGAVHSSGKWPITWKEFKTRFRLPAKTLGFGILYGVTPAGLQQQILSAGGPYWTVDECGDFIRAWYEFYYGVYQWTCLQHSRARRYRMVWDLFGRWRWVPQTMSSIRGQVNGGLREAGNHPIQAGAQGIIKLAMAQVMEIVEYFQGLEKVCMPLLQIHDELIHEVEEDIAEEFTAMVSGVMQGAVRLSVPVGSSSDRAYTWGDLK